MRLILTAIRHTKVYFDAVNQFSHPSKVAVDEMQTPFFALAPMPQLRKHLNQRHVCMVFL